MRIIAGRHKGRRLEAPRWPGLRPTGDKLRETLFNIVSADVPGARVLDGCAGTGAVGLEALSRGAAHVTFADRDRRALELVGRNLARCGIGEGYAIIRADLGTAAPHLPPAGFDLIFLDPPYDTDPAVVVRAVEESLAPGGLLVVEHARRRETPESIGRLVRVRVVTSGDSALGFYRVRSASAA